MMMNEKAHMERKTKKGSAQDCFFLRRSFVKLVLPRLVSLRAVTSYCIIAASHRRSHALPAAGGSQVQLFMPLVSCAAVTSVLEPQPAPSGPVRLVDRLSLRRAL